MSHDIQLPTKPLVKPPTNKEHKTSGTKDHCGPVIATTASYQTQFIYLNVGGKEFATTRDTITMYPRGFLAAQLDFMDCQAQPNTKENPIHVDRDPTLFYHILEFCREEAAKELAELAVLVGLGTESEGEGALANKFIQAVRDLRTEVGIPDQSDLLKKEDFDDIAQLAVAEGFGYPVPRLLDRDSVLLVLNNIAM